MEINYQTEIENISEWMKNYLKTAKAKGYVIGLSGGIDSSVVAYLAVKAIGKEKVIGLSLPCETREDMSKDAKKLAEKLGINLINFDLTSAYKNIISSLVVEEEEKNILIKANIKARLRMIYLYMISGGFNYLVAGTSNLSEIMVGYFTKYGDGGVDIEPIGQYYKTEIYKMAKLMPEIPQSIIMKAPSADLWAGQTDEEELGITYKELDEILINLNTPNEQSFSPDKIEKVKFMISRAIHKNNMPPRYMRN